MAEAEGRVEGLPLIHGFFNNNAKIKDLFSWQDTVTHVIGCNHTETAKESVKAPGPVKCRWTWCTQQPRKSLTVDTGVLNIFPACLWQIIKEKQPPLPTSPNQNPNDFCKCKGGIPPPLLPPKNLKQVQCQKPKGGKKSPVPPFWAGDEPNSTSDTVFKHVLFPERSAPNLRPT